MSDILMVNINNFVSIPVREIPSLNDMNCTNEISRNLFRYLWRLAKIRAFILTHEVYQDRDQIVAILQAIFQIHPSCATCCPRFVGTCSQGEVNKIPASVQIMACCRTDDNRRQVIIWINVDLNYWHIYASLGLNEFRDIWAIYYW